MRSLFFIGLASCMAVLPACLDGGPELEEPNGEGDSAKEVVFGIVQRTDPATGKTVTTAGHEVVSDRASTSASWAAYRQSWPDGWCRRFATSPERADRERASEGRAHFAGGRLGGAEIVLDANGADPKFEGAAFEAERPVLFDVDDGFGIPKFDPVEIPAPNTELVVRSPVVRSPGAERAPLALESGQDVRLEWSPRENGEASVMVAFDSDDRADHVRCFVRESEGALVVKASHLAGMRTGTVTVASNRTATVKPGDGWLVEIVASIVASEQRFVVR